MAPPSSWHLESDGRPGYVLDKDYWREPPGFYRASVTIASSLLTDIEVWNATGNVLLARRQLSPTNGLETVSLSANARRRYAHKRYFTGWGPFQAWFVPPPRNNQLEVRVWSPGGGVVEIENVKLQRLQG